MRPLSSHPTARLGAAFLAVLALAWQAAPVRAADLPPPTGEVVLTVTGLPGGEAAFDLAGLAALPRTEVVTSTIWTAGVRRFSGVSLAALLDAVGAGGRAVRAVALNDYSIEIPAADAVEGGALVADRLDGATMSVRDRGPLWIVYPYDANLDYRSETVYARSIWQLTRLEVLD